MREAHRGTCVKTPAHASRLLYYSLQSTKMQVKSSNFVKIFLFVYIYTEAIYTPVSTEGNEVVLESSILQTKGLTNAIIL